MASDWPRTFLQPGCFCLALVIQAQAIKWNLVLVHLVSYLKYSHICSYVLLSLAMLYISYSMYISQYVVLGFYTVHSIHRNFGLQQLLKSITKVLE